METGLHEDVDIKQPLIFPLLSQPESLRVRFSLFLYRYWTLARSSFNYSLLLADRAYRPPFPNFVSVLLLGNVFQQ